jgi:poly(3-hydroxybutyrate) depolymerase
MMAFAMACARHDLFAGIGTISAGMPKHVFESCRLAEPMLLVMINGDGETCCRMPAVTSAIPAPSSEPQPVSKKPRRYLQRPITRLPRANRHVLNT